MTSATPEPDPREQFERDVRGDHDSPLSYAWVPPADTTPSAAEVASWEA